MFSWFTKNLGRARIKPTWGSLEREGVNANKELLKKSSYGVKPFALKQRSCRVSEIDILWYDLNEAPYSGLVASVSALWVAPPEV